jgi:hypothetical protein
MGPTDKIAAAAFFISLSALVTNIALMWLKWPRIVVEVAVRHDGGLPAAASPHGPIHSTGEVFLLTVINNGSEPVTITSVGLAQRGHGAHRLDYLHTWRGPALDRLPKAHGANDTLTMPLRVEGHACHVFEYSSSPCRKSRRASTTTAMRSATKRFAGCLTTPVVSETRSKQTVMRSLQPNILR